MSNFLDELNIVSRTSDQIEKDNDTLRKQKIYDSMRISPAVLNEFDEQFLKALKSNIKTRAFNADYTTLPNGKRKLEGVFSYRQKYRTIGMSVDYFEGFTFPKGSIGGRTNMTFELNLLAREDVTKRQFFKEKQGICFYSNEVLLKHIEDIVTNEGIKITNIDGWPPLGEFISEKKFLKKYTSISIDFHYEIEY